MIQLKQISTGYNEQLVIDNLSLRFEQGELCSLLGPNGAGKSTLLRMMTGYQRLWSGIIEFDGLSINRLKPKDLAKIVAIIPQEIHLQFDYSVRELVMMGRYPYLHYWQKYSCNDHLVVADILANLDLSELQYKNYSQLSGGEKQRVNIARALAQQSEVILMDESLVHLDINHQLEIMDLLVSINQQQKKSIIIVSHNINLAADYCNRIILMKNGKIAADGAPEMVVRSENLKRVYKADIATFINKSSGRPNILYPGSRIKRDN